MTRSRTTSTRRDICRILLCAAAVGIMLLGTGGCEGGRGTEESDAPEVGVSREAHKGPVTITLRVAPDKVDLSQHVTVRVEIVADTGVTVTPESYRRALEEDENHFDYRIVKAQRKQAVPAGESKLRWRFDGELEFILPGEYQLPPARVSLVDERSDLDDQTATEQPELQTVETEGVTVLVRQATARELSPEELRTIKTLNPVELPREWGVWWWLGPLLALLAIVTVMILIIRRIRRPEVVVPIPAHEWAESQFAALVAADLIAKGRVQEYYYRISAIVRGYIERRFHVSAPEMTTEEFLFSAASDSRFGERTTEELTRFLNACDLVKYAKHQPEPTEPHRLFQAAAGFVERTREPDTTGSLVAPSPESSKEYVT